MDHFPSAFPKCPAPLQRALRVAPLVPLSITLTKFSRAVAVRHPSLFRRLGEHAHSRFILDPTDLPFVISLEPQGGHPSVRALRGHGQGDARIAGALSVLLGLLHGAVDGDALFFSRDLVIEGDTAAVLALRNAIDDSELDLSDELARMSGPFSPALRQLVGLAERRAGLCLSRPEEALAW